MTENYKKHQTTLSVIVLCVVVASVYLSSLDNGFVNWDDDRYVYKNTAMLRWSGNNILSIFTSFYEGHYFPLTIISYSIEYHFFGLNPFFYHLTNLIIHTLNCLLVFWLVLILSRSISTALITSLLFGIHPFHVGVVAFISNRKDLLAAFFFLGAVISYIYYSKLQAGRYYWYSLLLFILALLAKSIAVTLPLSLLLCDYVRRRPFGVKLLKEKIPYFSLSVIFGIIALLARESCRHIAPEPPLSWDNICVISHTIISYYLLRHIVPIHPYLPAIGRSSLSFWAFPFLLVALIAMSIYASKYSRKITFGLLFFLVTISPALRLINVGPAAVRFGYLPSLGLYYLIGEAFTWLFKKRMRGYRILRYFLLSTVIVVLALLFAITFKRCQVWQNGVTLYSDILSHSTHPFNVAISHYNRAEAYTEKEEYGKAILDLNQAIKISPNFANAYLFRAKIYYDIKDYTRAWNDLRQAAKLRAKINPEIKEEIATLKRQ